jgi:integrase
MLLQFRLGLAPVNIASMRPVDIGWQEATPLVRGNGRRAVRLPLLQDAGDAVLDYLENERPRVATDRIFVCANAPFRALRSGGAVSDIVRDALRYGWDLGPLDISRTRRLMDVETHQAVFQWVLQVLAEKKLLKGTTIGLDATTLEANAGLRSHWFGN